MNGGLSAEERALLRGRRVQAEAVSTLRGWYPVVADGDGFWWRSFGEKPFTEPFFYDTVNAIQPADRLCLHTPFDAAAVPADRLAPNAFIFHTSRCGSTLLTQLLATLPECVVMSEPPVLDSLLRRHYEHQNSERTVRALQQAVAGLGQKRWDHERHLFVKLDSWHICSLHLFRRAFPSTPCLFLYRRPDHVLDSHRRQPGRQMVPGLVDKAMPAFEFHMPPPHDLEGWSIGMLRHFYASACRHAQELTLINYEQLPGIVLEQLLESFSIRPTPHDKDALVARASRHSKHGTAYTGDPPSLDGNGAWTELLPLYAELERLRQEQNITSAHSPKRSCLNSPSDKCR